MSTRASVLAPFILVADRAQFIIPRVMAWIRKRNAPKETHDAALLPWEEQVCVCVCVCVL
jgi:hypothetical protein